MQLPLFPVPARPAAQVLAELQRLRRIRPAGPSAPRPAQPVLVSTEEQRKRALARLRQASPRTKAQRVAWVRQLAALARSQ